MSTQLISILALVDAYAPEKVGSPARTHLAVAINRALAAPAPAEPAAPHGNCYTPADRAFAKQVLGSMDAENQILRAENDSLRATLDRIAAMDSEGVRADDLGRAARIASEARAALSTPATTPEPASDQPCPNCGVRYGWHDVNCEKADREPASAPSEGAKELRERATKMAHAAWTAPGISVHSLQMVLREVLAAPTSPALQESKAVTDQQIYDAWFALSAADNRVNEHVRLGGVLPFARAVLALAGGKRGGG